MKIILTLSIAILFSSISYTIAQQGKPTTARPATTAAPKTAGKQTPYKPKLNTGTKPPVKSNPDHKQIKTEVGATGTTTNYTACANITLKNATLDFWPTNAENLDNPKKIKKQFVRVEIDIRSNCDEPYTYNIAQFHLKIANGTTVLTSIHLNTMNVPDQKTETLVLAKGQTMSTALYFEVPETETAKTLALVVNGYDGKGVSTTMELKLGK